MKTVLSMTLVFAILTFAGIGCAAILEFMTMDEAKNLLMKSLAIIVLLGICSALVAILAGKNNTKGSE